MRASFDRSGGRARIAHRWGLVSGAAVLSGACLLLAATSAQTVSADFVAQAPSLGVYEPIGSDAEAPAAAVENPDVLCEARCISA